VDGTHRIDRQSIFHRPVMPGGVVVLEAETKAVQGGVAALACGRPRPRFEQHAIGLRTLVGAAVGWERSTPGGGDTGSWQSQRS